MYESRHPRAKFGTLGLSRDVYFLFSLLALVFGVLFLFVAAFSAYGLYAMLRSNRSSQAYLAAAQDEEPLQLDHLSDPLRRLVRDARLLRASLEGPIRDVVAMRTGEFHETAGADLDAFDSMLMGLTRDVVEWVEAAGRLPEPDLARLEDSGATLQSIRHAIEAEGGAFERRNLRRPGQPPLDQRLQGLARELARFETAVQLTPRGYR